MMKLQYLPMGIAALAGLASAVNSALAQSWTQTSAPSTNWVGLASSADGTKLVAVAGWKMWFYEGGPAGPIFASTDSGATWNQTSAPVSNWTAVASSADGTKLIAAVGGYPGPGPIYSSTNSGAAWAPTGAPRSDWMSVASSADGTKLLAGSLSDGIYTSTDSGATWMGISAPKTVWTVVSSSADGSKCLAGGGFVLNLIYTSTDFGASWKEHATQFGSGFGVTNWNSMASSADGATLAAAGGLGGVFVSTNSGLDWAFTSSRGVAVASSADGTKLVAAGLYGISTSADFGATWSEGVAPAERWVSVASSADGNKLFAAASGGSIYAWQSTPAPSLSVTPSGGDLLLSWTVPSTEFMLEQNSELTTTNWTEVTNSSKLNFTNLQNESIVAAPIGNRFYRLKQ